MLASDHRWESTRAPLIVNNTMPFVAKIRYFAFEYQILTIITRDPLVRAYSDREKQDG
jgi:hypothetical protein